MIPMSMNGPMDTGDPINTGDDTGYAEGGTYVLGIYFFSLFGVFILCLISHICKMRSSPPIPLAGGGADDDSHYIRIPEGLPDEVLETFPKFLYYQTDTNHGTHDYGSGCSICLADYISTDMVRLLPECGHLFHVSCIDTWAKVHPTCPVCRNSLHYTS